MFAFIKPKYNTHTHAHLVYSILLFLQHCCWFGTKSVSIAAALRLVVRATGLRSPHYIYVYNIRIRKKNGMSIESIVIHISVLLLKLLSAAAVVAADATKRPQKSCLLYVSSFAVCIKSCCADWMNGPKKHINLLLCTYGVIVWEEEKKTIKCRDFFYKYILGFWVIVILNFEHTFMLIYF